MEVEEMPDLEECKKAEDPGAGDIKSKMTGAIAGLQLVKKKAHTDKAPVKVEAKITTGGSGSGGSGGSCAIAYELQCANNGDSGPANSLLDCPSGEEEIW